MEHDRSLGYFLEEANEHLHTIEQGLRKLPETVRQPTIMSELFRAAHSIEGSAAMLGLPEVQQIGKQFEANFKLLKEQPQIAVDNHLQSLFLASFSFLKAGIERVRQSSDPYRLDPAAADPIGDPVFAQLRAYLQDLLATANPTAAPVIRERDRTQDIGIAPDLEASIDFQNRSFSGDLLAGNNIVQAPSQKLPDLLSINDRLEPINFDRPDDLADLFALPNVEFDADAIELNELMNLLSNEMPTEGMWTQDDDFLAPSADLDLLDLDLGDYQLQPDLGVAVELDVLAPAFSLDPISGLFPSIAPPENWAELEDSLLSSQVVPPVASVIEATGNEINLDGLSPAQTIRSADAPEETQIESSAERLQSGIEIPEITNGIAATTSDLLWLEELNSSKPSRAIADAPDPSASISWLDNSVEQDRVDDFDDLQLDILSDSQPVSDLAIGDDFAALEIDLGISGARINPDESEDLTELELSFGSNDAEISAIDRDLMDLEFSFISNDLNLDSTIDRELMDLDFSSFRTNDLNLGASDGNLAELNLNPLSIGDLEFDLALHGELGASDLNPAIVSALEINAEIDSPPNNDPIDFNLDIFRIDDLGLGSSVSDDFADLDLNFDGLSAVTSDESSDFGNISIQPGSNLTDTADLDALLGVASTATGAGQFDDLDALMAGVPTTDLAANLDDILGETTLTATENRSLEALPSFEPPAPTTAQKSPRRAKQSRTFEQTMRVSVRHLDNLNNLVGELVVNRNTLEQDQNRMRQFVEKLLSEVQKLNEVGKRMQDLYERSLMENSLVASRQQSKPALQPQLSSEDLTATGKSIEYDPLEMDRFTPIHLLSQKMIELTVRVRESTADIEFVVDGSTEVTRTLRQIAGQLQEDLTKSRMLPFAQTADRLQRGVRDNGLKYGKQIELSVEGRDTLIDKVILESLADPLIHMVNNAIAHGIESTETRLAVGKSSESKITIRAIHQGNQTIISISDDGAGIDTERVKAKAIAQRIITAQQAATMSKTEAYDLLFLPSFSTKDRADELSGRGVGMDIVRTSITEIRGTITTESQLGVGTTFTIRLPLALSIAKALIAVNNKRNIAFPMDGIEDTQDVSPEQVQMNSEGKQCIVWRDELMPFTPLSDLLGFNRPLAHNNFYTTTEDDSDLISILILRSDGNLTAVQVDKITGDQEIVIKPLQGPASKPLGIAGATVMGDGRIIPIADVMELIALAKGTLSRQVSTKWTSQMTVPTVEVRESMVLIVDDSITVRELLSLTFKRAGYRVEQARDGQEAWDKLRAGLPCDIVFCDIEMPRMDGLEFLSRIQKDPALIKIPIAMLTSRGGDRHRQIAAQLGASGYFIKPYLEEALLDAAKRMIGGEVLEIV